jgi:hypothetical protein
MIDDGWSPTRIVVNKSTRRRWTDRLRSRVFWIGMLLGMIFYLLWLVYRG